MNHVLFGQDCDLSSIQLQEFGHTKIDKFEELMKEAGKAMEEVMVEVFPTVILRWQYGEARCVITKEKELKVMETGRKKDVEGKN